MDALEQSREIDFKNAMAVSFGNLGVLHHYEGRYGAALTSLEEALAVLQPLDDKRGLAEFTLKQAAALLDVGRLDAAKAKLDAAEAWVRDTGNRERSSDYYVLRGEWTRTPRGHPGGAARPGPRGRGGGREQGPGGPPARPPRAGGGPS